MTPSVRLATRLVSQRSTSVSSLTAVTAIRHLAASAAALAPRMISAAHGLSSVHTRSMMCVGSVLRRGPRAYPSSPSIDSTRTRVSAATSARPLSTFDTVGTETSAAAAIAAIVMRFCTAVNAPPRPV
jgi:hypothetical protein